jgi:transcriptional regulator with XRE-family HTH domain
MLIEMREYAGIERKEMAELLDTDPVNVWRWETDKNEIKLGMFMLWVQICGYNFVLTQVMLSPVKPFEEVE